MSHKSYFWSLPLTGNYYDYDLPRWDNEYLLWCLGSGFPVVSSPNLRCVDTLFRTFLNPAQLQLNRYEKYFWNDGGKLWKEVIGRLARVTKRLIPRRMYVLCTVRTTCWWEACLGVRFTWLLLLLSHVYTLHVPQTLIKNCVKSSSKWKWQISACQAIVKTCQKREDKVIFSV